MLHMDPLYPYYWYLIYVGCPPEPITWSDTVPGTSPYPYIGCPDPYQRSIGSSNLSDLGLETHIPSPNPDGPNTGSPDRPYLSIAIWPKQVF